MAVHTTKCKIAKKEKSDRLYKAILTLETEEECYNFFQDLCTIPELRSMEQRYEVATLLNNGLIYNDILERTGASSATISRVNRSLIYGAGGYESVLDLACGTGAMTWLLTGRGYELIAVDGSEDMLAAAMGKSGTVEGVAPIFLHQSMPKLDLYGTVDAAICCLDSLNYLTRPADVQRTFQRLHLFIAPGGLLVFDINTVEKLAALDGQVFLDETEDTYCVWRTEYRRGLCTYYVDLFRQQGDGAWDRELEIHRQRAYTVEELTGWLKAAGFTDIRTCGDMVRRSPREGEQRIYFTAIRK